MNLNEIKTLLPTLDNVRFQLTDGSFVPDHFHVTEVGIITKRFIDCGGTVRNETVVNFQLWNANDEDHRLKPGKLLNIIALSEKKLGLENAKIEVEYQGKTIEKYHLGYNGSNFVLEPIHTDCLAKDNCGVPAQPKTLTEEKTSCCTPGGGCC
jgi:Family of unknown function (DUF6428)